MEQAQTKATADRKAIAKTALTEKLKQPTKPLKRGKKAKRT